MLRFFANLSIRTKVVLALTPLVGMVLFATLYSSIQMHRIDDRYSNLNRHQNTASITLARANQRMYR